MQVLGTLAQVRETLTRRPGAENSDVCVRRVVIMGRWTKNRGRRLGGNVRVSDSGSFRGCRVLHQLDFHLKEAGRRSSRCPRRPFGGKRPARRRPPPRRRNPLSESGTIWAASAQAGPIERMAFGNSNKIDCGTAVAAAGTRARHPCHRFGWSSFILIVGFRFKLRRRSWEG